MIKYIIIQQGLYKVNQLLSYQMDLVNLFWRIFEVILNFILSINFIILLLIFILGYHILLYFLRDLSYLKVAKEKEDSNEISLEDLKETPLVNFVIPAWKEGKAFEDCLNSLKKLSYPNLRVIINAGGSEETMKIADSFKKYDNFKILEQKEGSGKIKAINEGLKHVTEGLLYLIDADCYITDKIFLKMISMNINQKIDIVVSITRPLLDQESKDFVKYVEINRHPRFRVKFTGYVKNITPNTCMKYEVLKSIGMFPQKGLLGDGWAGNIILKHGYRIFELEHYKWRIYTYYPEKTIVYIKQNIRWLQNPIFNKVKGRNKLRFVKFTLLTIISLYMIIFPIFLLVNPYLSILGFLLIISFYFKNIRKILFFLRYTDKESRSRLKISLYIKLIYYIYIDVITNIYTFFEILIFRDKKYKRRKNIS